MLSVATTCYFINFEVEEEAEEDQLMAEEEEVQLVEAEVEQEEEEEEEDQEVTRIFRMADDPQYSEAVTKTRNHSISVMESADKGRQSSTPVLLTYV
jgi:hypothetical protein